MKSCRTTVPFFLSHQGCPHLCVFCDQRKISGEGGALPSPGDIVAKIELYRMSSPRRELEVAFFGGSFTLLPRKLQEQLLLPLQPLLASGKLQGVRISTRPDAVDSRGAAFLSEMGVGIVELGVQSMDEEVLSRAERGHGPWEVERAFSNLLERGIRVGAQLMPGLPGDTREKSLHSLRRVLALRPACIRIYPALVLAGTPLARMHAEGSYRALSLEEAVSWCGDLLLGCLREEVPVIRMGLQPTEDLQRPGEILAGPFHPAFRQLVEGELFYTLIRMLAGNIASPVRIICSSRRRSDVAGHGRRNMMRLREAGVNLSAIDTDANLPVTELRVVAEGVHRVGDIRELAGVWS